MRYGINGADGNLPPPGIAQAVAVHVLEWHFADGQCRERLRPVPFGSGQYFDRLTFGLAQNEPIGPVGEPHENRIFIALVFRLALARQWHTEHDGTFAAFDLA